MRLHTLPLALFWLGFVSLGPAVANFGPRYGVGDVTGEPVGIIDIEILSETLRIDLRPLLQKGRAQVKAVYELHNSKTTKNVELLFVSGSPELLNLRVWLDDRLITPSVEKDQVLPASWQPPKHTPGFDKGEPIYFNRSGSARPVAFDATVPTGLHVLKVEYSADLVINELGFPGIYNHFAYILAPAKSWSRFDGLDVSIDLPSGWRVACNLHLAREGDTLKGHFGEIPEDALTMTLQFEEGWFFWFLYRGAWGLFVAVLLGGIVACWIGGRAATRRLAIFGTPGGSRYCWPMNLGVASLWGMSVVFAGIAAVIVPTLALPMGQASSRFVDVYLCLGIVVLPVVIIPIGFIIGQAAGQAMRLPDE
jgi:hypothetical protein